MNCINNDVNGGVVHLKIYNGHIVTPYLEFNTGTVLIKSGIIDSVAEGNPASDGAIEIDAQGAYVSPGLIDLQINGYAGLIFRIRI